MLIKCIADSHNHHHHLDLTDLECDILIHAGDACTKGNYSEAMSFLLWFVKQPAKYKILVPGNHDNKLRTHTEILKLAHDMGIHLLLNDYIEIKGLKIFGNSTTFWSEDDDTDDSERRIEAWKDIPEGLDLLITHMPPRGILDANKEGLECGCTKLLEKVKEVKPYHHIFGHIHEFGGRRKRVGNTHFINCAVKNEYYITVRGAMEIEL